MWKHFTFLFLANILLAGCQAGFTDVNQSLSVREMSKLSAGKYTGVAWVSKTTLVLEVDEGNLFVNQRMCSRQSINIYEMKTNQLRSLPLPFGNDCRSYIIRNLQVLSDQQAGYVFEYPKLNSLIIKSVDIRAAKETDLYTETASNSSLDQFSYSPDMKELLIVDVQSTLLKSAIYLLDTSGTRINITADFLRADFPVWSQKGNLIAFFGTKPYPGSDDKIEHFSQLERRVDYPWRLYLYVPESLTTEELPLDVVGPSSLKWSPDGKMLAFSGEYKGLPGVWIVGNLDDHENLAVTRIINGLAAFDFSPDSTSIAYAYLGLQNTDKQDTLYVIDLQNVVE